MQLPIAVGLTAAALAALCACSKPEAAGQPHAGGATADAAAAPLAATQTPHRRPGLWRQVMVMDGMGGGPGIQLCIDQASEARMSPIGQRGRGGVRCGCLQFSRNLDGSIRFSQSCDLAANGRTSTSGVIRGDFNSAYTVEADTRTSGSRLASMNGDHKMTIKAAWTGPCAPGQKGGDVILPGGVTRNVLENAPPS